VAPTKEHKLRTKFDSCNVIIIKETCLAWPRFFNCLGTRRCVRECSRARVDFVQLSSLEKTSLTREKHLSCDQDAKQATMTAARCHFMQTPPSPSTCSSSSNSRRTGTIHEQYQYHDSTFYSAAIDWQYRPCRADAHHIHHTAHASFVFLRLL
jgi:hypothetical protein